MPGRAAARQGARRAARRTHRPRARGSLARPGADARRRDDLPRGRRRRGQRGEPHPVERGGLRLRACWTPATGVHFQDRGASFSLDPAHPNVLAPRKRTAHTLLPGMLFRDGERRPWVVAGSMGGDIQPQIHVQLVSALVDGGADIATAVAAPRVVVEPAGWFAPPVARAAPTASSPRAWRTGSRALGHDPRRAAYDGSLGHEHAIELVDGGPAADGIARRLRGPPEHGARGRPLRPPRPAPVVSSPPPVAGCAHTELPPVSSDLRRRL